MFGHNYFGRRYFGSHYFGPAGLIVVELSGFANFSSMGSLVLSAGGITIRPAGFSDIDSFGGLQLSAGAVSLSLHGFSDADAIGSPVFNPGPVTIALAAFADADLFGGLILQAVKKKGQGGGGNPGGVAAGQKYGTRVLIDEPGLIIALEADSGVTKSVNTRMGLYSEATALPNALRAQSATKSTAVAGPNRYDLITPVAVLAGTEVWPTLHSDGNFSWFLSSGGASRFNADAFNDGLAAVFGASTASPNKAPIFAILLESITLTISPAGVASTNAFGVSRLGLNIAAAGIPATNALGSPTLAPGAVTLSLTGFANQSTLGAPVLDLGAITIRPDGFADADAFGALELAPAAVDLTLSGFVNDNGFGSPTLALEAQTIGLSGFSDADAFGLPSLVTAEPLSVNRMWLLGFRERPVRALEYPHSSPHRILEFQETPVRDLPKSRIMEDA